MNTSLTKFLSLAGICFVTAACTTPSVDPDQLVADEEITPPKTLQERATDIARNSLIVSCSTAVIATFLGLCTAYSDFRYNFRCKGPYLALILLPPTIPLIIMALAMLAWLSRIGMSGQLWSIILAHSVMTAPFAMAIIRLRLHQMDPDLEAAAWNLGGNEWQAMRHVIVPFCAPAIVSALCLTAAVSFDEFAVAWFVSGLNKTVPIVILEIVQGNIDPTVNAIGTFVFLTSMSLVILAQLLFISRQIKSHS